MVDLGFEDGKEARPAESLVVLGSQNYSTVDLTEGTGRWHGLAGSTSFSMSMVNEVKNLGGGIINL